MNITACYDIDLPARVRIRNRDQSDHVLEFVFKEFHVKLTLLAENSGPSIEFDDGSMPIRECDRVLVAVTREESEAPPRVGEDGDHRLLAKWIQERESAYKDAALAATNRTITFFRHFMYTPHLLEMHTGDPAFYNPEWTDEHGERIPPAVISLSSRLLPLPGDRSLLSQRDFALQDHSTLLKLLKDNLSIPICQEFLSDAQSSILDGRVRRAVLELAIACETAVKLFFFSTDSRASAAFEFLEDSRRVNVKVIELLHGAAKKAFGTSFQESDPASYRSIDFLFRARNKVAHRGEPTFRDDNDVYQVDTATLIEWWFAVVKLFAWIKRLDDEYERDVSA